MKEDVYFAIIIYVTSNGNSAVQTKLTLRMDDRLVKRAKAYAKKTGKSVSRMVADYFSVLGSRSGGGDEDLTPTVRSLKGALRGADVDIEDYQTYLRDKHL